MWRGEIARIAICSVAAWILLNHEVCTAIQSNPVNESNATGQREAHAKMNGAQVPYTNHATAEKDLESYVFGGKYGSLQMPTNLNPADVEGFVRRRLDRTKAVDAFSRTRRLVDYYELGSVRDHFERMLTRNEHTQREVVQSLQIIVILTELGDGSQNDNVSNYFRHLAQSPSAPESFPEFVQALEAVGTDDDARFLTHQITVTQKDLEKRILSDSDASDEFQRINYLLSDDLPRVMADRQLRERILKIREPDTRIEQLCRVYLGWGENDNVELTWWSARWIRRESRAGRVQVALMGLHKVEKEIDESDLPGEEKDAYTIRAARAIRFLGGELTPKETRIIKAGSGQIDVLDRQL
jgi:hypothetical protein